MIIAEKPPFTLDGVRDFHKWTHAAMDVLLEHLSTMPEGALVRTVGGFGMPTLREQAVHIFNCEGFWVHMLYGLRYTDQIAEECQAPAEMKHLQEKAFAFTHEYLSHLTEERLNKETSLCLPDGSVLVRTPAYVLHHVLTHAFHHKGQMAAMCRLLGHPTRDTDMI